MVLPAPLLVQVKPSVLHGDLWSGNIASVDGQPAVFDPAMYYGAHAHVHQDSWRTCCAVEVPRNALLQRVCMQGRGWERGWGHGRAGIPAGDPVCVLQGSVRIQGPSWQA
jgi:hypothetical protein